MRSSAPRPFLPSAPVNPVRTGTHGWRRRSTGRPEDQRECVGDRPRLLITTRRPPSPPGRLFCGHSAFGHPAPSALAPTPSSCHILDTSLTAAIAPRLPLALNWMAALFLLLVRRPPRAFRDRGRGSVAPARTTPHHNLPSSTPPSRLRDRTRAEPRTPRVRVLPRSIPVPEASDRRPFRSLFHSFPSSLSSTRAPRSLSLGTNQTHSWRKS